MNLHQIISIFLAIVLPASALIVSIGALLRFRKKQQHLPLLPEEELPPEQADISMPPISIQYPPDFVDKLRKSIPHWPNHIHRGKEQYARYLRSKHPKLQIKLSSQQTYTIIDPARFCYTSLHSCTCSDFNKTLRGLAPCKHIYFLARYCDIDVDQMFHEIHAKDQQQQAEK